MGNSNTLVPVVLYRYIAMVHVTIQSFVSLDVELTPTQVSIRNEIFTDSASKLKTPKQD